MSGSKTSTVVDLTKPLDKSFIPFAAGNYSDPSLEILPWSSISEEGFCVSRLALGTQSGTHIDAPAHFLKDGATLESLLPEHLIGNYFLLDMTCFGTLPDVERLLTAYRQEKIIFLRTGNNQTALMPQDAMQKILSLPLVLLVVSGDIAIEGSDPFAFHRLIARAGKFLVEDVDLNEAKQVTAGGEIFVAPLRLIGVSGSPCRVMVRLPGR